MKVSSTFAIGLAGVAVVVAAPESFAARMFGAFLIALFWQQSGWLAHDFLHHQVMPKRVQADLLGIFIGNVWQGFSVEWWKNKHNTHHALPNVHYTNPEFKNGDPDIDTMPLLAWSRKMALKAAESAVGRFFITNQAVLYFPILLIARMSWVIQSAVFVFQVGISVWGQKRNAPLRLGALEGLGLVLHYAWYFGLMARYMSLGDAIVFLLATQMMCGFMLALVFGLGHNGMSVYDADALPDFLTMQVTTTRNVHPTPFTQWFMGGLEFQLEHHLFPYVPRHNMPAIAALVKPLCKKHGIPYVCTDMVEGSIDVLKHLTSVSKFLLETEMA
jgi:acyl-lipid Delta6-acetylenase / acyl-lipid (9-3)-desaturase